MFRSLFVRSLKDGALLLSACCALMFAFIWVRMWVVSQMDFREAMGTLTQFLPDFLQKMLPVPLEMIATIEGRITFGYEELPVGLLTALWAVTRGSECMAGRLGDGTMEMLLSQPVRRLTLVTSHVAGTLVGAVLISLSAWLATYVGIETIKFDEATSASTYWPAALNLLSVSVFVSGFATLASAIGRSRAQAVAIAVSFYAFEITCKILGLLSSQVAWLKKLSYVSLYEPTWLTIGIKKTPDEIWPIFWQYNGLLLGLGLATFVVAATIFCHRDVPAPL